MAEKTKAEIVADANQVIITDIDNLRMLARSCSGVGLDAASDRIHRCVDRIEWAVQKLNGELANEG
jgi:hypothetical protein